MAHTYIDARMHACIVNIDQGHLVAPTDVAQPCKALHTTCIYKVSHSCRAKLYQIWQGLSSEGAFETALSGTCMYRQSIIYTFYMPHSRHESKYKCTYVTFASACYVPRLFLVARLQRKHTFSHLHAPPSVQVSYLGTQHCSRK